MGDSAPILLTGATGYVGGRLLQALLERGERVRCFARRPEAIPVRPGVEVVAGDMLDPGAVRLALDGVEVAYYLVHSLGSPREFEERDRRAALTFARAAREAGLRRIVYLGGLGDGPDLSSHLASRQEVGRALASTGVETIEFRASIVLGSGSLSFELIRSLVERLPVLVTPRWVWTRAQPIAIEDVVAYLVAALDLEPQGSEVFEIGGADIATYGELMQEYARQRGLRRHLLRIPVLTPRLSSLWLGLVTPVYARVGRKLIESLPNETVVRDPSARERFAIRPRGYREAIARALANEDRDLAATRWSDAFSAVERDANAHGTPRRQLIDSRAVEVPVPPALGFAPIRRIGGRSGWYFGDRLWRLRGFLDLLVGGAGLRRGRRDPETPSVGSALDFWRVEAYEPGHLLRLRAEMRMPGRAWLQFEVVGDEHGSRIRQTAVFDPVGVAGILYWYALLPLHAVVFRGMLAAIARRAVGETAVFEASHTVPVDLETAFAFFSEPANLGRLTPRLLRFRLLDAPRHVEAGTRLRYRMAPLGLPVTWVAEIAEWRPPHGFAHVQMRGPYEVWRHAHTLSAVEGGTEVRDRIEYRLRGGPLGRLTDRLGHRAFLERLFAYRSTRLDELLDAGR
jgi:uncharacterized protein YbjT (DUF2867 family)/ligand-binding SRPBCC domain-containing protein